METKMAFEAKDVKEVFLHLDVEKRKKMLAKLLHFPEFNAEDDLKTAVLIDSYYELLSHLVENGFPWREIASFLEIFKSLLNKTQGTSVVEAISLFKEEVSCSSRYFGDNSLKCAIDYLFLTFFQHYKLYQFLLTKERACEITNLHCVVEPPATSLFSLMEGVPKSVWDEQQRLQQIDEIEQIRNQEREAYFEQEIQQAVQRLEEQFYEFESLPEHVTREQLTSIIRSIAINKAAVTNASISQKIQQIQDLLEFKYKRSNVDNETVDKDGKKSAKSGRRSGRK
ncbi:uncharacterized protein C8orf74-like [Porites lutea]|uniref:uncharacterized protein C8orf74-like n=1 Tax=Porites lutea TaxID=51062 RepID=UPI003CC5408D